MNSKLSAIFSRRSVRTYTTDEVNDSMITDILEAAMAAPSAVAKDPWEFIVVKDKSTLSKIADGLPNGKMLDNASAGIVVCGDIDKAHDHQESYMLQDCSAAIQNLLLAASSLGLGACWLGVHPRQERMVHMSRLFCLPDNIIPIAVVSIGVPSTVPTPRTRYKDTKVHVEKW